MFPRIQGLFYHVTEKRAHHCGENSTSVIAEKKIEDHDSTITSGDVKVDVEDKNVSLVDASLEAEDPGHVAQCMCPNCDDVLYRFAECGVCLEPLQGRGPYVCPACGGMWCDSCSRKISRCVWCRSTLRGPAVRCVALQRLINDLRLPCRNSKRGCTDLLTSETRAAHEENCKYDGVTCPLSNRCLTLPFEELSSHLKDKHNLIGVYSRKIRILIENLQSKLKQTASCKTKYKILLLKDKCAFIIKVSIYNYHIRVEVMRLKLSSYTPKTETKKNAYCALVEFQSKNVSTKSAIRVEDGTYSKKAEVQWTENIVKLEGKESITVHVAICQSTTEMSELNSSLN